MKETKFPYKKYLISRTDNFEPTNFPHVVNELNSLKKNLTTTEVAFKEDILISYLRRQSLDSEWIVANPDLSSLVSSGVFATTHLEALFECSKGNKEFQKQYETYLRKSLS
jgi:hypothetical protein